MNELISEDTDASLSLADSIRHQVIAFSQRLRIDLFIIDKLMSMYNETVASDTNKATA